MNEFAGLSKDNQMGATFFTRDQFEIAKRIKESKKQERELEDSIKRDQKLTAYILLLALIAGLGIFAQIMPLMYIPFFAAIFVLFKIIG